MKSLFRNSVHTVGQEGKFEREAGFTLLELLIVLAILALIAALAVPQIFGVFGRAQADVAKLQLDALTGTLGFYRLDVGRYPTEEEGLASLINRPDGVSRWAGPYLSNPDSLTDPWGNPYVYRVRSGQVELVSYGADGQEGGEGENTDIKKSLASPTN